MQDAVALGTGNSRYLKSVSGFLSLYLVDSGDGGNANLVQGDNTGGIFNGPSSSESPQERQGEVQGD